MCKRLFLLLVLLTIATPAIAQVGGSGGGRKLPPPGGEGECLIVSSGSWSSGSCAGNSGAPTDAEYWTGAANATLSAEKNLGALGTGLVINTAGVPSIYAGVTCTNQVLRILDGAGAGTCNTITSAFVDATVLTAGASAAIAAAITDETGSGALVFATSPTLVTPNLGTPSAATLTNATGLPISTGVSGLGANVATFLGTPSSANLVAAVTGETGGGALVFGTGPTIDAPVVTSKINLPSVTAFPGTPSAGDTVIVTDDSAVGACDSNAGSAVTICRYTGAAWSALGGGAGSIGGSTGGTDRAIILANGTGGATIQASGCTISAGNALTCAGGFVAGTSGTGVATFLEGTAPGAGTNVGEHNLYFDSADSKLKSHENGGSAQTYVRASDNLGALAATSSAQLASVLSDETGSGVVVYGTSPTITTPTISGAVTFPDGVSQTFNPNGTASGLNVGAHTADPSAPNNGDVFYNSTSGKFRCREGGSWVDCINTGAGTGDVTDVNAGAGIGVTNSGGPAPTVAWDASTFVNNITLWDSANASRTLTAGLSGATDPVITFSNSTINVSTGDLQVAGSAVTTAASTTTLTNKTLDVEGTGNVITIPKRLWFPAAGCNNATAGSVWDLPTSNPAVAACKTGTNTQLGVLDFADASNLSAQLTYKLPSTWSGAIDANIKWMTSATSGDVVWQFSTICVADAETDDPAFNTASTVTDTAKGTTNQTNDATITGVTATGCAAGELIHLKIHRDSAHASDTLAATARLIGVELVIREAL